MTAKRNQAEPGSARFVVGIDLGTTNCALAYVDTQESKAVLRDLAIPQRVAADTVERRVILPSCLYEPAAHELPALADLPWESEPGRPVVGTMARDHGAEVPGRLIISTKSWLSHAGIDRTAAILPWHGAEDVTQRSPMEASALILGHLRAAWNQQFPAHPLEEQDVYITVPASFDEIARELTVKAAAAAGLPRIALIEEPQAAFYCWMHHQGAGWKAGLTSGATVLVCDVGGGTTDFSLIRARPDADGSLHFHRVAVGDHLILGGDNLDLALAHHLEARLLGGEERLEPRQWNILVRRCQQAKETLLGPNAPDKITVHLPGTGARLIGGGRQVECSRAEAVTLLLDGFLPRVSLDTQPDWHASGFREFGLPYAPDPGITRYLASFLSQHAPPDLPAGSLRAARPDFILLNGGFFESPALGQRLLEVIAGWFNPAGAAGGWQPQRLQNDHLYLAVSRGAAWYGMVRRGAGERIRAGLARAYYIGAATRETPTAICLAPAGLDEGQRLELARDFEIRIRQPVEFPLYSSSVRTTDQPGDLVPPDPAVLSALPPIRTVLRSGKKTAADTIKVRLCAELTPIGTLEVWCRETSGDREWRLQFDVRPATQTDRPGHVGAGERGGVVEEHMVQRCCAVVRAAFSGAEAPDTVVKSIEEAADLPRDQWPPALLRPLWETLLDLVAVRERSAAHEIRWASLLGFCLRPGYGFAVDDWRVSQTWKTLSHLKPFHARNEQCRAEWWVLWRRVSGGLSANLQQALATPLLAAIKAAATPGKKADLKWGTHERAEVWRLLAALEWLPAAQKQWLGSLALAALDKEGPGAWNRAAAWSLARLGARVPAYGPLNTVVKTSVAEQWLTALLAGARPEPETLLAVMQLSRRTQDRHRDISHRLREQVLARLQAWSAPPHYLELVGTGGTLMDGEQRAVFGESIPPGLMLL